MPQGPLQAPTEQSQTRTCRWKPGYEATGFSSAQPATAAVPSEPPPTPAHPGGFARPGQGVTAVHAAFLICSSRCWARNVAVVLRLDSPIKLVLFGTAEISASSPI